MVLSADFSFCFNMEKLLVPNNKEIMLHLFSSLICSWGSMPECGEASLLSFGYISSWSSWPFSMTTVKLNGQSHLPILLQIGINISLRTWFEGLSLLPGFHRLPMLLFCSAEAGSSFIIELIVWNFLLVSKHGPSPNQEILLGNQLKFKFLPEETLQNYISEAFLNSRPSHY